MSIIKNYLTKDVYKLLYMLTKNFDKLVDVAEIETKNRDISGALNTLKFISENNENVSSNIEYMKFVCHMINIDPHQAKIHLDKARLDVSNKNNNITYTIELINIYGTIFEYAKGEQLVKTLNINKLSNYRKFLLSEFFVTNLQYKIGWKYFLYRQTIYTDSIFKFPKKFPKQLKNKNILIKLDSLIEASPFPGIGETLIMLRMLKVLKHRGAHITLLNVKEQDKMNSLYNRLSYIDNIITYDINSIITNDKVINDLTDIDTVYDRSCYILDLPYLLSINNIENVPTPIELHPLDANIKQMKKHINVKNGNLKIGIQWKGGSKHVVINEISAYMTEFRYIDLDSLLKTFENIQTDIVVFQKMSHEETEIFKKYSNIKNVYNCSIYFSDMENNLALLDIIDEYVGIKNTYTYMRSILKKEAKTLMTSTARNWLWNKTIIDNPWYPYIKTYWQHKYDWKSALKKLKNDLEQTYKQ